MSNENTEFEDGDDLDPFETELVAYLDGELDASAARRVEAKLASDPAARARADELKKSFDMLDYLPKPEPSPDFATRTLDKLPAAPATASGSGPRPITPTAARPAGVKSGSAQVISTSMPVALPEREAVPTAPPSRRPLRAAALVLVAGVFAVAGYFVTGAVRPVLFPPRDKEPDSARTEPKVEPDSRVIENLPLYALADDLAFVQELTRPDLFGEDPAVAYDPGLKIPAVDTADKPTGKQYEALTRAFRALPLSRQQELVKLDADLRAREPKDQDRLFRALEAYAVWLERLTDPERRAAVLGAATPAARVQAILELREQQWVDALPAPQKKMLDAQVIPKERADLKKQWKDEEATRRDRWAFVRQHAAAFAENKSPWPFDTETGRKEVKEFVATVFRPDDPKRTRLFPDELAQYRQTLLLGERDGAWAWYGLTVYELSQRHPHLPEPADPKTTYTDLNDLPDTITRLFKKKDGSGRLRAAANKWPEFPLELHRELSTGKGPSVPQLGPARVDEFKPPVREFANKELFPKLTADEKSTLRRLEGKWPEYPREFVRLATRYNLPVPGVTLPGPPKQWDATYGARLGARSAN